MADSVSNSSLPFVTVAIGTYNRARWLNEALKFLTTQDYPLERYELIIVDNNSKDDTRTVVESFAQAPKAPRYVFEGRQGSSWARNRAIAEAKGEIIVFTDDDVLGKSTWLSRMIAPLLMPGNENVGVVGGETFPIFPDGLPKWIEGQYTCFGYRKDIGPLKPNQLPSTANVAIRRSVFEKIGTFRTDLGRTATRLTAGEDNDLMRRIYKSGVGVWFNPHADLEHVVPGNRLTFKYMMKLFYDASCSRVVERSARPGFGFWVASRLVLYALYIPLCVVASLLSVLFFQVGFAKRMLTRASKSAGYVVASLFAIKSLLTGKPIES